MSFKRLFHILLICIFATSANAQNFEFNSNCKLAYEAIIKLDFEGGKKLIDYEKSINPSNQISIVLENYIDFLTTIIGEEEKDFEAFKDKKRNRIKQLKKGDEDSPYYYYSLAHVYLQLAFARFKFEEYLIAGFELRKAFHLLKKNQKMYPNFLPNQIDFGLMHALVGAIPNKYKWLAKLAAMNGSIKQGYDEIYGVLNKAKEKKEHAYLLNETIFFLTFIELNLTSKQENASRLLDDINELPNDNQMLVFAKVNIMNKIGKTDEIITLLADFQVPDSYFKLHYIEYLHGLSKLNRLDEDAYQHLQNYLNNFNGKSYKRSALQKIAWYYLINGNQEKYKEYIASVAKVGNSLVDGDKQALTESKSNRIPQIDLLKARLQFDGAYYDEALRLLESITSRELRDRIDSTEYIYRKARVFDALQADDEALKAYYSAYVIGKNLPDYFAGNSLLKMGVIYENRNELNKAKDYYNRCIDLDFEVYKNSIELKAKAGLDRIKTKKGA